MGSHIKGLMSRKNTYPVKKQKGSGLHIYTKFLIRLQEVWMFNNYN